MLKSKKLSEKIIELKFQGKNAYMSGEYSIGLADVLIAVECVRKPNAFKFDVDSKGYMTLYNYRWEGEKQVDWDLEKNLADQSKEVINFLEKILC